MVARTAALGYEVVAFITIEVRQAGDHGPVAERLAAIGAGIAADFASPAAGDCVKCALRVETSFPDKLNRRRGGAWRGSIVFSDVWAGAG
jgi:hypothetical protein